jgi:hypothetical protein
LDTAFHVGEGMTDKERIAELEAALESVIRWQDCIAICAPELGGVISAMNQAKFVLDRKIGGK